MMLLKLSGCLYVFDGAIPAKTELSNISHRAVVHEPQVVTYGNHHQVEDNGHQTPGDAFQQPRSRNWPFLEQKGQASSPFAGDATKRPPTRWCRTRHLVYQWNRTARIPLPPSSRPTVISVSIEVNKMYGRLGLQRGQESRALRTAG